MRREVNVDIVFPSLERIYNKKTFMGDKLKHVDRNPCPLSRHLRRQ